MHGSFSPGAPIQAVPRGWSGCVGPAAPVSQEARANNCQQWIQCDDQN